MGAGKIWTLGALCVFLATPLNLAGQAIGGTVSDALTGRPLPVARVSLEDAAGSVVAWTLSDPEGHFLLSTEVAGDYFIVGSYLGGVPFRQGPVSIGLGHELMVEFVLPPAPVRLDGLTVEVERRVRRLERTGFYKRQSFGGGVHIAPQQIDARRSGSIRELLRTVPGIRVPNSNLPGQGYILFRAAERVTLSIPPGSVCAPRVLLDGYVVQAGGATPMADVVDLDDILSAGSLAGIEIYRRPAEIPAQYGGAHSLCGVLVVWTLSGG